jgi:O-antigen/teichoic acid export membrane protein
MIKFIDSIVKSFFGNRLLDADKSLFARGLRKTVLIQAVSTIFVFASSLLLVNIGTVSAYGIYVHVFNWLTILAVIACFGMEDIVLAEIPGLLKKNKSSNIVGLLWHVNKLIIFFSVTISIIFLIIVFSGLMRGLMQHKYLFLTAIFNIYLIAFIFVNQQALQAFNRFYASQIADKIIKPILIIAFLSGSWLIYKNASTRTLILCNTLALLISAIIVFIFLRKTIRNMEPADSSTTDYKGIIKKSGYFLLISLFFLLKSRISMLIFGGLNDTDGVAILNITLRLADFVFLPFSLIHAVVPQLFASHSDSQFLYKKELFNKITRLIAFASGGIMIVMLLFGKKILGWYDSSIVKYYDVMIIFCAGQLLYSFFGPCSAILMMQGKQRHAAIALFIDIAFSCVVFFVLIKEFGLIGAAWASLGSSFVYNFILRIMVQRHLFSKEIPPT